MMILCIIAIILLLVIYVFATYNSLVKLSNQVKEAFATMDVYLKKRWDLIPNVLETVKGYVKHEKETLNEIVELRNGTYEKMNNLDKVDVNNKLSQGLNRLMAIAESYPDLKASENFKDLSNQLAKVEEDIANSRKYYNGAVRVYNNKVQMFPSNLFAGILGFKEQKMFEIADNEKQNIKVEL